ncbi:MAG: response regulator transcription factor [Gammaproteobacteria bacterium]|nr:response regulator transcription factor [Gammaproteobacteria bacterium]
MMTNESTSLDGRPAVWLVAAAGLPRPSRGLIARICLRSSSFTLCRQAFRQPNIRELTRLAPHLLLLDDTGLAGQALQMAARISRAVPTARILLMGDFPDNVDVVQVVRAGVWGVIPGNRILHEAERAMESVMRGEVWFSRSMISRLLTNAEPLRHRSSDALFRHAGLTSRERAVAQGVLRGHTNKEIGSMLNIAESTVKIHLHSIYLKLNVRRRTELFLYARRGPVPRRRLAERG